MTRRLSLLVLVSVVVASFFAVRIFEPPIRPSHPCTVEAVVKEVRRNGFAMDLRAGDMMIRYYGEVGDLRAGDLVRASGYCTDVRDPSGKYYSPSYARYLTSQGIYHKVDAKKLETIEKRYDLYTLRHDVLRFAEAKLEAMYGKDAPMIKALVYGDRSEMSDELTDLFSKSGTAHILALSGFHVGILAAAVHVLFAKQSVRTRGIGVCLVLITYAFLTGLRPSILRAVIFFALYYLAFLQTEKFDLFSASAMTASFLLVLDPRDLYDRGFVLSFVGVFSIALFYIPFRRLFKSRRSGSHPIVEAVSLTLAAQALTLPLGWYYFGRISLVSVLSNLVVVPLISLMMILAILSIFVHTLSLIVPLFYAVDPGLIASVRFLQDIVLEANRFFAGLPYAYLDPKKPSLAELMFVYAVILALYLLWELYMIKENRYEPQRIKKVIIE